MTFANPWFLAALIGIIGWFHVKLVAELLNASRLGDQVPDAFKDVITEEDQARTREYHAVSTRLSILEDATMLAVTIAFWAFGGFAWLDREVTSLGFNHIVSGLVLIVALIVGKSLLGLPFDWWSTFKIEAAFGFNKTTLQTFIADRAKGMVLGALLGLPLLALLLWFFETQPLAALYAWLATSAFGLIVSWLSPRLFMPWFMTFTPMPESSLRNTIFALAEKLRFPVIDIAIVDGSRRSTKANAFFTGFGRTRRIALFDTLIASHSEDEIVAVLAHEIGHAKLGHVPRQIIIGLALTGIMFGLLHFAMRDPRLFAAFGVASPSTAMGLVLFMLVYGPWSTVLDVLTNALSQKHEFQADAYAAQSIGSPRPMIEALKKLSRDHLAHLTPHPFYVRLHYSHPPVVERITALEA